MSHSGPVNNGGEQLPSQPHNIAQVPVPASPTLTTIALENGHQQGQGCQDQNPSARRCSGSRSLMPMKLVPVTDLNGGDLTREEDYTGSSAQNSSDLSRSDKVSEVQSLSPPTRVSASSETASTSQVQEISQVYCNSGSLPREPPRSTSSTKAGNANLSDNQRIDLDVQKDGSLSTPRPLRPPQWNPEAYTGLVSGQKRTAAGDIKSPSSPVVTPHVVGRHRSRTIDSACQGNRIAELSVHLRARLSYAAAQVEKSWQSRGLHGKNLLPLMQSSSSPIEVPRKTLNSGAIEGSSPRLMSHSKDSLGDVSVSAPGSPTSHPRLHNGSVRVSPRISSSYSNPQWALRPSRSSPTGLLQMSKLVPPPNTTTSSEQCHRHQLPNPNEPLHISRTYNPSPRHRRYYSQQEFSVSNLVSLVPETPLLGPSPDPVFQSEAKNNTDYKRRSRSQNALMEQDAIETLLFMSSPGNSGCHPSSQDRDTMRINTNGSTETWSNAMGSQTQQGSQSEQSQGNWARKSNSTMLLPNLETQAGDEIDRLLDQMDDSDSEDERGFSSYTSSRIRTS